MNQQIKLAYEQEGLNPEEIALAFGLEIEAVIVALNQCSTRYRRDCGKNVAQAQAQHVDNSEALETIRFIMRSQKEENAGVAAKCAIYLREEEKGRNDARVRNRVNQGEVNVIMFNEKLMLARQRMREQQEAAGIIDISSESSKLIEMVQ